MACKRGALIVLEGVDKAGKSTQCKKLVEALQQSGHAAEMMRFPDRTTTIGKLISAYLEKKSDLEDHTVHLLFSANRWEMVYVGVHVENPCAAQSSPIKTKKLHLSPHCRPHMKSRLEQGTTLVVDRYAFSGAAFTSAKPGFSLDWCTRPDVGLPKPDLVVFLQLSPAQAALRGQFGEERYETGVFQRAVQQRFEELMKDSSVNWKVVDASQSVEDVHDDITALSLHVLKVAQEQRLEELWK
ncbi:thymidylate kinase isoform X1 [Nerophis lumbriciformis]|uniref:thymidylate kinase isoform X1 n=1 Tax=Nerophis lumbriciformis TaxID=546530 RepID=UPI003BA8B12B